MPRGKSWLMATVALKFFLLSLHTSSLPRWGGLKVGKRQRQTHLLYIIHDGSYKFQSQIFFFIISQTSDKIVEKTPIRCLLSMLCSDVLFPRNCVGCWSCERLPSGRLGARKYQSAAYSQSSGHHYYLPLVDKARTRNSFSHLKIVFADAASFAQALHDGFVPQDVLLT